MYIAIFVISIVVVIMFHEFGHFATAKLFGMKAEKFFLGFGPTLWSVRKGETEYGVKAIPAGGFVKIVGMSAYEEVDPADADRTFHSKPGWQRAIVLAAGSVTHFIVAVGLLFAALAFVGIPNGQVTNQIDRIIENTPAAAAGLQPGDEFLSVAGQPTPTFEDVRAIVAERAGETIPVEVLRDGQRVQLDVTVGTTLPTGEPGGFLGVGPVEVVERMPAGEAFVSTLVGERSVFAIGWATIEAIGRVLSPSSLAEWFGAVGAGAPRDPEGVVSLVGVGQAVNALGSAGETFLILALLAQLNITLGIMNLLPLPPLDGGHLAVLAIEEGVNGARRLRGIPGRWRLDPQVLTPLALAVILFFVVISVTALYVDITQPASELFQ
jgi:membrane-associated protease RseP (regulator of RpoE activity)